MVTEMIPKEREDGEDPARKAQLGGGRGHLGWPETPLPSPHSHSQQLLYLGDSGTVGNILVLNLDRSGFKSCLFDLLAICHWVCPVTSLRLSYLLVVVLRSGHDVCTLLDT